MDLKIWEIFLNKALVAALSAQVSSQIIKVFLPLLKGKPPDLKKISHYGGIPSAHTAFLSAATVAIGLVEGFRSSMFALAGVVSAILIYDIIKMRKVVEINSKVSKAIIEKENLDILDIKEKIPQFQGHSFVEVIAGGIWGILWALLIVYLFRGVE